MRRLVLLVALSLAAHGDVAAQDPDTTRPQATALRQRIEERFAQRVQEQLALSDEQAAKLRATSQEYGERRRKMEARERDLRVALTGQLRPGVAANEDSVARLTKALVDLRVDYANTWRDEMNALSYLTPVQRAQLYVMRDRLLQRVQEIRDERGGWRRRPASP
jgi:Spy/CpxP family protein refolding chaperone